MRPSTRLSLRLLLIADLLGARDYGLFAGLGGFCGDLSGFWLSSFLCQFASARPRRASPRSCIRLVGLIFLSRDALRSAVTILSNCFDFGVSGIERNLLERRLNIRMLLVGAGFKIDLSTVSDPVKIALITALAIIISVFLVVYFSPLPHLCSSTHRRRRKPSRSSLSAVIGKPLIAAQDCDAPAIDGQSQILKIKPLQRSQNGASKRNFFGPYVRSGINGAAPIQPMRRDPPPLTHGGNADYLAAELDYDEMLALAGLFRQWAISQNTFKPEQRTQLIALSADFEELAQWAGEGWRAFDPSNEMSMLRFLARRVLRHGCVVKLEHAKHWLGRT